MQVKKFISFIIVTVGLIVLSLPVSFAKTINAAIEEPEFGIIDSDNNLKEVVVGNAISTINGNDTLYIYHNVFDTNPSIINSQITVSNNISKYQWDLSNTTSNLSVNLRSTEGYDLNTGNLVYQQSLIPNYTSSRHRFYANYTYHSGDYSKLFVPDSVWIQSGYSDLNDLEIVWAEPSPDVPDQIQLKSPLSEPVADKYNSYAVLDNRLIWISYRINGIYTRSASIENISEVYSYNAQLNESGTGTYAGQQNGYTENIEIPSQSISGSYSGSSEETSILTDGNFDQFGFYRGTEYDVGSGYTNSSQGELYLDNLYLGDMYFSGNHSGVTSGAIIPGIDFTGVNSGSVHFNSNGTVSLKDVEYYPVSFNHNDIFEYFRFYCLPTANNNFVFWLAPDRSFVPLANTNQLLVNMDFYYSEFDLEGNYIRSTFHTVTETDIGLFDAYQTEEPIHAVKFYGIDFFNVDNLPFNLSSVLWQYDFEFKEWRDNMLLKLNDIYNLLANAQNMPEPGSYNQWGNELNEYESNYSNMSPEQVNIVLKNALGNGRYDNAASQIKAWINNFSIGELIAVCVFALALGTVTLTLGKKKSD